jgi:hypothetical protein
MCFTCLSPFNQILQQLAGECMWKIERADLSRSCKKVGYILQKKDWPGPSWAIDCLVRIRPQCRGNGESSAHPLPERRQCPFGRWSGFQHEAVSPRHDHASNTVRPCTRLCQGPCSLPFLLVSPCYIQSGFPASAR